MTFSMQSSSPWHPFLPEEDEPKPFWWPLAPSWRLCLKVACTLSLYLKFAALSAADMAGFRAFWHPSNLDDLMARIEVDIRGKPDARNIDHGSNFQRLQGIYDQDSVIRYSLPRRYVRNRHCQVHQTCGYPKTSALPWTAACCRSLGSEKRRWPCHVCEAGQQVFLFWKQTLTPVRSRLSTKMVIRRNGCAGMDARYH